MNNELERICKEVDVVEGMDVGVRSSNDIYDPIGQVGW
jgi:hypothetical protein